MIENRDNYLNNDAVNLVARYEEMIANNIVGYFDVDEFENILDHYMQQQQITKALGVVNIAYEQHPQAFTLQLKKAELLANKRQFYKALQLLDKLEAIEESNPEIWLLKGNILALQNNYAKAKTYFDIAITKESDNLADTLFRIAIVFEQLQQHEYAYEYLQQAYRVTPNNKDIIFELAYCSDKLFINDKTIELYKKYLDINPFSDSAWYNLGIVYNRMGEYLNAIDAYEFAIAINPKHSNAYYNMGNSSVQLSNYEDAIKHYFDALELDEHAITYTNIGECFEKLDDFEQALQYYETAINIDETVPEPWFGTGFVLMYQDRMDEAKIYLEKACELDPENPDYWYALGSVYSTLQMPQKTVNAFQKAIDIFPYDTTFAITFAEFYHQTNKIDKAIEVLSHSLKINKNSVAIWNNLIAYYILTDNENTAEFYLKKAMDSEEFSVQQIFDQFPELKIHKTFQKLIKRMHINQ